VIREDEAEQLKQPKRIGAFLKIELLGTENEESLCLLVILFGSDNISGKKLSTI
jgi:hypothetical protein